MTLTDLQRRTLNEIQCGFPLNEEPYAILGERLGVLSMAAQKTVNELRQSGIIRRIGGSFVSHSLGLQSTLVAVQVRREHLASVAGLVSKWPEVTHNYERRDAFNLWFTVTAATRERLEEILEIARGFEGVENLLELPSVRMFKLRCVFKFGKGETINYPSTQRQSILPEKAEPFVPDTIDRCLIPLAAADIGCDRSPFGRLALCAGTTETDIISRLERYLSSGVMRRFGAIVRHRRAGLLANGMCVWNASDEAVKPLADLLCARDEVSHCYERTRAPEWPWNVYAMMHCVTRETVRELTADITARAGVSSPRILFSTRQFKKTSIDLKTVWQPYQVTERT